MFSERVVQLGQSVVRTACGEPGLYERVVNGHLVFEYHQRNDIAGGAQVGGGRKEISERPTVGSRFRVQPGVVTDLLRDGVSHVTLFAVLPRHVPAAPALVERAAVAREKRTCREDGQAGGVCVHRAHEEAGDASGPASAVTGETTSVAAEFRAPVAVVVQDVERRAELWIAAGNLERPALHKAHVTIV